MSLSLDIDTPEKLPDVLRRAAEQYRQSVLDLQSAWQDEQAGTIWDKLADTLEAAANSAEKKLERWV